MRGHEWEDATRPGVVVWAELVCRHCGCMKSPSHATIWFFGRYGWSPAGTEDCGEMKVRRAELIASAVLES